MTRDSRALHWLQAAAIVLAIAAATITNPADYGLSPIAVKWLMLISTIVGTVAGRLGTSPLPGAHDASRSSTPSKLPVILLAVGLGGLALGGSACSGKAAPPQLPAAVASTETALRGQADKALGVLDAALDLVDEVNTAEKSVEGLMSEQMKADTRAALTSVVRTIRMAAVDIKAGVASYARLKQIVDPVLASTEQLQTLVHQLPAPAQSRFGFGQLVSALFQIVLTNLGAFSGAPVPQGV